MECKKSVNSLCEKAGAAASSVKDTTKTLAKIGKYKVMILRLQESIRKDYERLGRIYYKDFVTDEEPDEAEYDPLCKQISDSYRRITRLREAIAELKDSLSGMEDETDE